MRLGIRTKLFIGFSMLVFVSYAVQGTLLMGTYEMFREQMFGIQAEKALSASSEIESFLSRIEISQLSITEEYLNSSDGYFENTVIIINNILKKSPQFQRVAVLSTTGKEHLKVDKYGQAPPENLRFEIPSQPFDYAVQGGTGISKVYILENGSAPYVNIYTPIFSKESKVVGVVKGEINLSRMWDIISQTKIGDSGFAYVVDEEGRLIAHKNFELVASGVNFSGRSIVSSALKEGNIGVGNSTYFNETSQEVLASGVNIPKVNWAVIIEQPKDEAYRKITTLSRLYYSTFAGSIVLMLIVAFLISESLTTPIRRLKEKAETYTDDTDPADFDINSFDEIQDLSFSFKYMFKKLREKTALISNERNKLRVIISSISDAVIALDGERKIIMFNPAAEKLTGFSASEVIGKSVDTIIKVFDKNEEITVDSYCPISQTTREGIIYSKNSLKITTSAKESYVNFISGRIKEARSMDLACILTLHDVTKEAELEEMKLDFVSMTAHELRTPLTSMRGYVDLLMEELSGKLDTEHLNYLERLAISTENLRSLIDNLLNVSRIEQGSFQVDLAPVDLGDLVSEIAVNFEEQAKQKDLLLTCKKPKGKLPMILADRFRIAQVLNNLIGNAITYTKPKGAVTVSIKKTIEKNKKMILVSVSDTGEGIPEGALPKLFTKFFRVSGKLEQGSKGTGLGLYISKSIIDLHKGKIWAESQFGKGSTFSFTLPVAGRTQMEKYTQKSNNELQSIKTGGIIFNKDKKR
jgi:PAS domain S-box-containing protein